MIQEKFIGGLCFRKMRNLSEIIQEIVPGPNPLEKPTWGETSDSPRHGLHVNSLLGLSVKPKVEIESKLEKRKFWISASFSIKFQF